VRSKRSESLLVEKGVLRRCLEGVRAWLKRIGAAITVIRGVRPTKQGKGARQGRVREWRGRTDSAGRALLKRRGVGRKGGNGRGWAGC